MDQDGAVGRQAARPGVDEAGEEEEEEEGRCRHHNHHRRSNIHAVGKLGPFAIFVCM